MQAQTAPSLDTTWDPPTHRISNSDCNQVGAVLTAAEIATLQYSVSYREKGATTWINLESPTNSLLIPGLKYSTTYQITVGAHFAGTTAFCATEITEFVTGVAPPPAACTNLRLK